MKKEIKIQIAKGWIGSMVIGLSSFILLQAALHPIITGCLIFGLLVVKMTIWAVKQLQS